MSTIQESVKIENVVASSDVGQELELNTLTEDLPGTEFNPENFPGLVFRMEDPKAAALIFRSGKVVCTGANSVANARAALEHVFEPSVTWGWMWRRLRRSGFRTMYRVRTWGGI